MRRIALHFALLCIPVALQAQFLPGSVRAGRADVNAVSIGFVVRPTTSIDESEEPVRDNCIWTTDGTTCAVSWDAGSDTIPTEFLDDLTTQVVLDSDDFADATANYLTINLRRDARGYFCRDDSNVTAYAAGWDETEIDVVASGQTFSCLTAALSKGDNDIPGNDGDMGTLQAVFFVRDYPLHVFGEAAASAGECRFTSTSSTLDEQTTASRGAVERVNGSAGAVSCDVDDAGTGSCVAGTDYTAFTANTNDWADEETGTAGEGGVSIPALDISANCTIDLELKNTMGGIVEASPNTHTVTLIADAAQSGVNFFVDCDTGDDGGDGSEMSPWGTLAGPASALNPDASEHVFVNVQGTCNDPPQPQNAGTDWDHMILYRQWDMQTQAVITDTGGSQCFTPAQYTGSVPNASGVLIQCNSGGTTTKNNDCCGADDPSRILDQYDVANFVFGMEANGVFTGRAIDVFGNMNIFQDCEINAVGNPWRNGTQDYGDMIQVDDVAANEYFLMDGCILRYGGHNLMKLSDGRSWVRGTYMKNLWADFHVSFDANDGKRLGVFNRDANLSMLSDNVLWGAGQDANTGNNNPVWKCNGTNNAFIRLLMVNGIDSALQCNTGTANHGFDGVFVAHVTVNGMPTFLEVRKWSGTFTMDRIFIKNSVVIGLSGDLIFMDCNGSMDITDGPGTFLVDGLYVDQDYTVDIDADCGGMGADNLSAYVSAYSANFQNVIIGGNADLGDDTELEPATYAAGETAYTPGAFSVLLDEAEPLTKAANSGSSATNLQVDVTYWWADVDAYPVNYRNPRAGFGPDGDAGCVQVRNFTQAWTRCVTAVAHGEPGTLTLGAAADWNVNDDIGLVNTDFGWRDN